MDNLSVSSKWRNVVELSCMSNNDEVVFYTDAEVFHNTVADFVRATGFSDPRLVVSRPVFDFEVQSGLDTSFYGRRCNYSDESKDEKAPPVTLFLDAYFVIRKRAEFWQSLLEKDFSPSRFVAEHVGGSYYDCLSGGFPLYELMICRFLCQDPRILRDTYVYPSSDEHEKKTGRDYVNLQDFLDETADTEEKFRSEFALLLGQFSLPMLEAHNDNG